MDIRLRLISLFAFALIIALSKGWLIPLVGLLTLLTFSLIYHINIIERFKRVALAEELLLIIVVFLPFTHPGTPLFKFGPIQLSYEGLREALLIFFRSSIIILGSSIFLNLSEPVTIIRGLYGLRFPYKLVEIAFFALRYISVVESEHRKLKKAMKARGFKPSLNLHTYKSYAYLLGMILLRSYDRAERVYKAMLARGFNGKLPVGG